MPTNTAYNLRPDMAESKPSKRKLEHVDVTLKELASLAKLVAGGDLSRLAGWTITKHERGNKHSDSFRNDSFKTFIDPSGARFRSIAEVTRHLALKAAGGGTSAATSTGLVVSTPIVKGSTVWAKMPSYPPWPAVVTSLKDGKSEVQFFATDDHATLSLACLQPYAQTAGWQKRKLPCALLDGSSFRTAVELANRHLADMDGLVCDPGRAAPTQAVASGAPPRKAPKAAPKAAAASASADAGGGDPAPSRGRGAKGAGAVPASADGLPPGWTEEERQTATKRKYSVFHGPGSARALSKAEVWRKVGGVSAAATAAAVADLPWLGRSAGSASATKAAGKEPAVSGGAGTKLVMPPKPSASAPKAALKAAPKAEIKAEIKAETKAAPKAAPKPAPKPAPPLARPGAAELQRRIEVEMDLVLQEMKLGAYWSAFDDEVRSYP